MRTLDELYQQVIIDHSQQPHNFYPMYQADYTQQGYNPLCGDRIELFLRIKDEIIREISFQGEGCAIALASASLLGDAVKNRSISYTRELCGEFQNMLTRGKVNSSSKLGKLAVLAGVAEYPMRIKCATLAWHTLKAILATRNTD